MTALVQDARPMTQPRATLRSLAGTEARRFARHPVFLLGVVFSVITMVAIADDRSPDSLSNGVLPAFFLGIFGMIVAYRLTRSTRPSAEAVDAAPVSVTQRTAALCLACLVPAFAGLVWLGVMYATFAVWPPPEWAWAGFDHPDRLAILVGHSVVAALGASLLGVAVARWLRFPGAIVLAVVVLIAWVAGVSGFAGEHAASVPAAIARLTAPFALFTSVNAGASEIDTWLGSPRWHLLYLVALSVLAAVAALLRGAVGRTRTVLLRAGAAGALVAVLTAVAAVTGGVDEPLRISRDGSTVVVSKH